MKKTPDDLIVHPHEQTILFEVGDIVYDPYFNECGEIVEIVPNPNNYSNHDIHGTPYFNMINEKGHRINSSLRYDVSGSPTPIYLQLFCKKGDIMPSIINMAINKCKKK